MAIPFGSFDTRSMAMGGAGVAVGGADAAPLFNPALLSVTKEEDNFAIILPTIGIRVADPDKLRDSIDSFQNGNYVNNLQTSINTLNTATANFNATPNPTTQAAMQSAAATVGTNLTTVSTQLGTLSNKPITVDGGLATVVGVPSKKFGVAFYANGAVATGGLFEYKDAATISALATQATCLANATTPAAASACGTLNFNSNTTLQSGIHFKGVALGEMGFALSHEFKIEEHDVAFGITPKIVKAQLFDALININSNNQSNVTGADYIAEYSFVNFDIGAAKNYSNGWRTGFVIKNVIPQTLDFKHALTPGTTPVATGETLSLKPQARLGVSKADSWYTVALDVDLTKNDPAGFEKSTQYIALGGELNGWDWVQLRAGYRVDMSNSDRNVTSIGLGFSPFGVVHADLAVAGNANEIGASFQLGVHF
jgi:hypothetical protein